MTNYERLFGSPERVIDHLPPEECPMVTIGHDCSPAISYIGQPGCPIYDKCKECNGDEVLITEMILDWLKREEEY